MNNKKIYEKIHNKRSRISIFEINNINFIKKNIPDNFDTKIIDIGCGKGYLLKLFEKTQVFGVDIAKNCLIYNIKNFIVDDITMGLGIKSNTFDIVTSIGVLEHFEEKTAVKILKEIHRILKPNGIFVSTIPNKNSFIQKIYDLLKENKIIRKFLGRPLYNGKQHIKLYTIVEYKKLLKSSGFLVGKILPMNIGIFNLIVAPFAYEGRFYLKYMQPLLLLLIKLDWFISKCLPAIVPVHIQYCYFSKK